MNPKITTTQNDEHSEFGASSAARWRKCPGSVASIYNARATGRLPKSDSSIYADEGTEAHEWARKVLSGEIKLDDIPDNFRQHIAGYIHFCDSLQKGANSVFVESKIPLFYRPEDQGTVDFAVIHQGRIETVDLKYGAGVEVEAELNDQLVIYTLSMIRKMEREDGCAFSDDFPVLIHIYQPGHHSFTGEPKTWETTVRELKDIGIDIEADYRVARDAGARGLNPSPKTCQFCPLNGKNDTVCMALAKLNFDPLIDFEDESGAAIKADLPQFLTPEQRAFVAANGKQIKKMVDDIMDGAETTLLSGEHVPGLQLVQGKLGNRTWADEEAAETFLKARLPAEDRYQPRKLITAPQALAKLKPRLDELSKQAKAKLGLLPPEEQEKSKAKCLIHRSEAKPLMVAEDDPRPAIEIKTPEDEFADESNSIENTLGDLL